MQYFEGSAAAAAPSGDITLLPNASVTVNIAGTSTKAALYDFAGIPIANPITASPVGAYGFRAADGEYDVIVSGSGMSATRKMYLSDTTGVGTNLVFAGDSITVGTYGGGATPYSSYFTQMAKEFSSAKRYNKGVAGRTLANIVSAYTADIYPYRPSATGKSAILFVLIGTNDVASITDPAAYFASLQSYWATAKADGFKVLAATIPPQGNIAYSVDVVRSRINRLIRESDAVDYIADFDSVLRAADGKYNAVYFGDNLHPNDRGNKIMAKAAVAAVRSAGFVPVADPDYYDRKSRHHNGALYDYINAELIVAAPTALSTAVAPPAAGTGDCTVAAEVYIPSGSTGTIFIAKSASGNNGFGFNSKRPFVWGSSLQFLTAGLEYDRNYVVHFVKSGSTVSVYLDGEFFGSITDSYSFQSLSVIDLQSPCRFARNRMWNSALTADEVRQSYLSGLVYNRTDSRVVMAAEDGNVSLNGFIRDMTGNGRDIIIPDATKAYFNNPAKYAFVKVRTTAGGTYSDLTKAIPKGRIVAYTVDVITSGGGAIIIGNTENGTEFMSSAVLQVGKLAIAMNNPLATSGSIYVRGSASGYVIDHTLMICSD